MAAEAQTEENRELREKMTQAYRVYQHNVRQADSLVYELTKGARGDVPEGKLLEFYGRQTEPSGCDYCRGLVLEPDGRLTAGFGGEVLWQGGASAVPC